MFFNDQYFILVVVLKIAVVESLIIFRKSCVGVDSIFEMLCTC